MKLIELSSIIFILIISFFVNFYFGHQGLMPLDDLQNFNSGHRILKGDFPFRDYYSITGPILDIWQSIIYRIFGSNWQSLIIHASLLNCIYSISIFFFLKKLDFNTIDSFFYSICSGLLMFPPAGNPTVEHNSLALSIVSFFILIIGLKENKNYLLFIGVFIFLTTFFIKQVPTAYFIIFYLIIYFSRIFSPVSKRNLIILILSSMFAISFYVLFFLSNGVSLKNVIEQYFIFASNLGENRFSNLTYSYFYDKISKIFFLLFLIIPSLYSSVLSKKIHNVFFIFGLSLIISIYEIHSNNQPITFSLIPIFCALFYYFHSINNPNSKIIKYILFIMITYCFYRILRYEILYIFVYLFILIVFFFKKKISLRYFVLIYLFISTLFYFEKYVKIRAWDDLKKNEISQSFKAEIIDDKLKYLKWKTVYFKNSETEKKLIFDTLEYLKSLNSNERYILITDYQIYNLILDKKDFSPVKYWHINATYPSKNHKFRKNFEDFFKSKIVDNDVTQIIIDNTAGFKNEEIKEFKWLYKCLNRKILSSNKNLYIFHLKKNCLF